MSKYFKEYSKKDYTERNVYNFLRPTANGLFTTDLIVGGDCQVKKKLSVMENMDVSGTINIHGIVDLSGFGGKINDTIIGYDKPNLGSFTDLSAQVIIATNKVKAPLLEVETINYNYQNVTVNDTDMDISGNLDVSNNLDVSGATTLHSTLDVIGDTSVTTFDSTGATSLATSGGNVNIASSGAITTVEGSLNVDEAVTLDSNLTVLALSTFNAGVDMSGAIDLSGGSGAVTLDVSGTTTLHSTLSLPLHADVDTTLTTIESNVSTLQTKTTGISTESGSIPQLNIGTNSGSNGARIMMEGLNGDLDLSSCVMENRLYDGTDKSELIFFKGNDNDSGTLDRIRLRSGQITFDCFNTSSMDRTAEDIKATIDSNSFNINTAQLVVTRPNGNDNDGETAAEHALRITSGNDARTLFMGVDDTDQIGYINCAHTGSTRPICLQTRGSNVGVGNTNPSFKLDITGDVRTTGAMTTSSVNVTSSKKVKNVESSLDDVSTNQEVLDLFNSIPLSKYTYIDKIKNKDFIRYGLIAEDMPNEIYKTETKDFIPNIYQFADISFSNDKYTITFNEKLDISKIQNENSDNILCYFVKNDKYETDKRFILKDFEILDEYSITGNFKNNFEENKIFVYGVEGMIPGVNKDAYFEITSCVVKHLVKENNELKERLNKIEQLLNIN